MTTPYDPEDGGVKRRRRPDLNQLELFLKVVETRSFSAAARSLGRTQPYISNAIAKLEDVYGGDLFERRWGGTTKLTPIGETILPTARQLLGMIDAQMDYASRAAQSRAGSLTVGFYPGIVSGPLRGALADFIAESPDVGLRFVESAPAELHRRLNDRSIDFMLGALVKDVSSSALAQETLWHEGLVVALPADHDLAAKERLDWQDVSSLRIILRTVLGEISGYRLIAARLGDRPFECEHHEVSRGTCSAAAMLARTAINSS